MAQAEIFRTKFFEETRKKKVAAFSCDIVERKEGAGWTEAKVKLVESRAGIKGR